MFKKIAAAVGVGIVAASLLSGCTAGAPTSDDSGDVELTFLTFETPNLTSEYWDETIERTNELVPGVKIKKLVAPNADRDAYARQLDSTGELPDIMVAVNPTGLAEAGKLAEFSEDELSNWIDPTSNSFDGKIYQLPTNTQTIPMVYYRKADFEKAGITETPKTWDDLLAASEKLKAAGFQPFFVAGGGADTWANQYPLLGLIGTEVYAKDPEYLQKLVDGDADFSDPNFVTAATKLKTLVDKGYIDPATLSKTYSEGQEAFLAGEGSMYAMGSWFTVAPDEQQQEELGVFTWPSDDGSIVVPTYTGGGLSVSSSGPDVDKAKEWALAWSQVAENLDGGVLNDGLFIALKDYEVPAGTTPLYDATLALYNEAVESGTITTVMGNEGGTPSLPSGFWAEANLATADLINGQTDVDGFIDHLNSKFAELTQ